MYYDKLSDLNALGERLLIEIISVIAMYYDKLSDLNASGRKSSAAATNDAFHIAFGSKISGVPTAMSAGRKSSKEVTILLPIFV